MDCESLQNIDLKNVTELDDYCFEGCISLQTVDLKNVTRLWYGCFDRCKSLKEIIGKDGFSEKTQVKIKNKRM